MKTLLTKDNKEVLIREIKPDDAESSIRFSKQIFGLPTVLTTLNEFNQTVESQTKWIQSFDKSQTKFALVGIHNKEVVGLLDFSTSNRERLKHGGAFGVSVLPEFQNNGIARAMIKLLLEWASKSPLVEKVVLKVSSNNPKAVKLYQSLGFVEEGRMTKEIKLEDGTYVDTIVMAQFV